MLPLCRKPVLEHIVDEFLGAGIENAIFVVSRDKQDVHNYFSCGGCHSGCAFSYVIQEEQLGLGHAILQAVEAVGNRDFAVALGDSVIHSPEAPQPFNRLLRAFADTGATGVILVQRTPVEDAANRYGIVKPGTEIAEPFEISDVIEKPSLEQVRAELSLDGEYTYAIAGRYVFKPLVFDYLRRLKPGAGGELLLSDAIRALLADGHRVWCTPLRTTEKRRDIGTFKSYFEAFCDMSVRDPEYGDYLKNVLTVRGEDKS